MLDESEEFESMKRRHASHKGEFDTSSESEEDDDDDDGGDSSSSSDDESPKQVKKPDFQEELQKQFMEVVVDEHPDIAKVPKAPDHIAQARVDSEHLGSQQMALFKKNRKKMRLKELL